MCLSVSAAAAATISSGINGGVLGSHVENVLVFPAAKAAQRIGAKKIKLINRAELVHELLQADRRVHIPLAPQKGPAFSANRNPSMLSLPCLGAFADQATHNPEKSLPVGHVIDHKGGES